MSDTSTLERRIAVLEDIEAIRQLKHRYFAACDAKRPDEVLACFAPGKVAIDYGRIGVFDNAADMVAVFTELACQPHMVEMHHAQNPQIWVLDAGTAQASWGLYYFLINTRDNTLTQLGGHYQDRYRKIDGEWKISATVFHTTSTQVHAFTADATRLLFAGASAPAA